MKTEKMSKKAKNCDNCLCWLEYCKAECCLGFQCPIGSGNNITLNNGVFEIQVPMSNDLKWYYELHGVDVEGNILKVPKENCEFVSPFVIVHMKCGLLTKENHCAGHTDDKPVICRELTMGSAKQISSHDLFSDKESYCLTPNCLFNYKT